MTLIISKERRHRGFKVETMRQSDHFYCLILLSFHHLLCFPLSKFTPPSSTSALKVPLQVSVVGFLHCLHLTTRGNLSGSQTKLNLLNTQHPHFFFFPAAAATRSPKKYDAGPQVPAAAPCAGLEDVRAGKLSATGSTQAQSPTTPGAEELTCIPMPPAPVDLGCKRCPVLTLLREAKTLNE